MSPESEGWQSPDFVAAHAIAQSRKLAALDCATLQRWTYAELDAQTNRFAARLTRQLGVGTGERVAFIGRNSVDLVIAHLAAVRAGAIFLPLNWRLTLPELTFQTCDARPRALLFDDGYESVAADLAAQTPGLVTTHVETLRRESAAMATQYTSRMRDACAASTILYTSGTSGRPKGAVLSERNAFFTAINFSLLSRINHSSVFLCDLPLFHVAALIGIVRPILAQGGTLLVSPAFDPAATLARLSDPALGVTHYMCVPQMAQTLRQHPDYARADLSRLVAFVTGGAPNPPALVERFVDDGVPMLNGYGLTEAAGTVLGMPPGDLACLALKPGSAGLPPPTLRVRLVKDDGEEAVADEVGEIWVQGPNVGIGYWEQPAATANTFADGWLRTGDAAYRDTDGFYYLVDRKKDMYISGGENVYPAEVEAAIMELEAVAEVAVFGVPDEQWGEAGCAYVIRRDGATVAAEDLIAHCQTRLARYKIPKWVVFTTSVPRTASGKVQKHLLRARHLEATRGP